MLLALTASPEAGETATSLSSQAKMPAANWQLIVDMYRSIYDEARPKQKTNAAGELLFVDANGVEMTMAEAQAAAPAAPAEGNTPGGDRRTPVAVNPVYRPRTDQEVFYLIAAGMTKGAIDVAKRRQKELAERAVAAPAAIPVTPINPLG